MRVDGRLRELDAVRGLAALAVVFGHLTLTLPAVANASRGNGFNALNLLLYSPLDAVLDGGAAVIVFFVLSGYVLCLSYERARQTYPGFLARRIARLWLPYIAAVAAAMALASILGDQVIGSASGWFNARWYGSVNSSAIFEHLLLVGHFHDESQYIPVIWTLVAEMRISLIFPLLLGALTYFGWRLTVVAAAILTVIAVEASLHVFSDFNTLAYVICFVAGAALASHHEAMARLMQRTTRSHRLGLLVVAILLLTYASWMPPHLLPGPLGNLARMESTNILLETIAAAILITLARWPGRGRALLLSVVPQYLGRVSYSLYLLHTIVLLAVVHIIDPGNSALILEVLPVILVVSIALADFSQRWVERPAQRLGRRVAARLESSKDETPRADAAVTAQP